MRRENQPENQWEPAGAFHVFHGGSDVDSQPGEADADRLVVIGDLGMDAPIALDYQFDPPQVIYLGTRSPGWTTVCESIDALITRLGLRATQQTPSADGNQ